MKMEFHPPKSRTNSIAVTTAEAARLLNRKPQTLRKWACHEDGPIRPVRIYGRLSWRTQDILNLLNGEEANGGNDA